MSRPSDKPMGLKHARPRFDGVALVVDDEALVRRALASLLQLLGFATVEAADGLEALEILRGDPQRFRLVVLDQTMPGLDGAGLFRELQGIREELPVVLVSGGSELELAELFNDGPAPVFLMKPFTLDDLAVKLTGIL